MSAVTFTGANGIDWGTVLNAVITQERQPIDYLASQQTALKTQSSAFATLASRLGALESVADALTRAAAFGARTASTTDDTVVGASATTGAVPGTYDITVTELARSQVTGSSSRHADTGTTVVATGGTITIGGKAVTLSGSVTLAGLAEAINGTTDIGVTATIVQSETGYQIVLTGTATGAAKGFTVTNALTGSTVAFTDTDLDGVSGDSSADNATQASDAKITVNNVTVTSSTNTITDAIPGTTLTLLRKQPSTPVTVSIREDLGNTETLVKGFVDAYNGLITFAQQQTSSTSGIGRDPMLKGLRNELRSVISASYAAGGTLSSLGQTGIEFDRTGKLTINSTLLRDALEDNPSAFKKLFMGDGVQTGAFQALTNTIEAYTDPGALLSAVRNRLTAQISSMDKRLASMEERLATRRAALQREYIAADQIISQLNSQAGSLSSLSSRLF